MQAFKDRFWLAAPGKTVWIYSILASVVIMALMGVIVTFAPLLIDGYSAEPSFMKANKLDSGQYWMLGVWVVFFSTSLAKSCFGGGICGHDYNCATATSPGW